MIQGILDSIGKSDIFHYEIDRSSIEIHYDKKKIRPFPSELKTAIKKMCKRYNVSVNTEIIVRSVDRRFVMDLETEDSGLRIMRIVVKRGEE